MSARWIVERPNKGIEDVGADRIEFQKSGGITFRDDSGRLVLAYAASQWVTVYPEDES